MHEKFSFEFDEKLACNEFTAHEDEISSLIKKCKNTGHLAQNFYLNYNQSGENIQFKQGIKSNVGEGLILFNKYYQKLPHTVPNKKHGELDTLNNLYIGIHTDEATRGFAEEILRENPSSNGYFGSYYYFDRIGNIGKTLVVPIEIKADLPVIEHPSDKYRFYIAKISSGAELELIGECYRRLMEQLNRFQSTEQ